MVKISKCKMMVGFVVIAMLGVAAANAAPLAIANPGFETGDLSGWTCLSNNGPGSDGDVASYTNGAFPGVTGNGSYFCWANWGHLVQTVGTVQANTVYTLTVQAGWPSYIAPSFPWNGGDIRFAAAIDGVAANQAVTFLPTFTTAEAGTFKTVTVSWTSPASGIPVGNQLEIQLWSYAPQVAWDNISLDATTVPEPGALLCIV
ncbi:MAG: hypothetical protein ACYC64_16220, partial [Armatimonadota bacterium]